VDQEGERYDLSTGRICRKDDGRGYSLLLCEGCLAETELSTIYFMVS
jgi:hypothetical protein